MLDLNRKADSEIFSQQDKVVVSTDEPAEQVDFQKYWFTLKRQWLPASIVFVTIPALALIAALVQEPIYRAKGTILIRPDQSSTLIGLDIQTATPQAIQAQNTINTQISVIKSVPIAQEVISSLNLENEEGSPIKVEEFLRNLIVKDIKRSDSLEVSYESENPETASAIVNKVLDVYIANNISVNRSEAIAAREFINQQLPPVEAAVRQAEQELQQIQEENQVVAPNREAQSLVDALGQTERRFLEAKARLAGSQARLETLKSQLSMPTEQASQLAVLSQTKGVQEVLAHYRDIQKQLAEELTRYDLGHPKINALQREKDALEHLLNERISSIVGDFTTPRSNTDLTTIEFTPLELSLITDILKEEVEQAAIVEQYNSSLEDLDSQRLEAARLPEILKAYGRAERRLEASQSTYQNLLERQQEIRITENQEIGNARIISAALVPEFPFSPNKKLFMAGGLLLGAVSAIATAFILDSLDMRLKTVNELLDILPYPNLGLILNYSENIPKSLEKSKLYKNFPGIKTEKYDIDYIIFSRDLPHSSQNMSYDGVRTNIDFLGLGKSQKIKYVITSSVPQEGKSTVSANLAASTAFAGRKVALIDTDLRRPSQHKIWKINNAVGLTNVLIGEVSVSQAASEVMPNLDLITTGKLPPNPVRLLESEHFRSFLNELDKHYDVVIIDTPPVSAASDAIILSRYTDGLILVARPYILDYNNAKLTRDRLKQLKLNPDGIVINGVDAQIDPYAYTYYKGYTYYSEVQE